MHKGCKLKTPTEHGHFANENGAAISSPAVSALFCMSSWLRGVDLNHRPLGYEPKHSMMRNDLQHNLGAWMAAKRV